jgi:hypothetical protein
MKVENRSELPALTVLKLARTLPNPHNVFLATIWQPWSYDQPEIRQWPTFVKKVKDGF